MASRFVTILTGRNLPKIQQSSEAEPSTINEKTIADFTRVVEQTGILERAGPAAPDTRQPEGPCPNSPAADLQNTVSNAGTFITAMFMSARLPSASAIRSIPTHGNGAAVFTLARIQATSVRHHRDLRSPRS
jgi:hypothetical protein